MLFCACENITTLLVQNIGVYGNNALLSDHARKYNICRKYGYGSLTEESVIKLRHNGFAQTKRSSILNT